MSGFPPNNGQHSLHYFSLWFDPRAEDRDTCHWEGTERALSGSTWRVLDLLWAALPPSRCHIPIKCAFVVGLYLTFSLSVDCWITVRPVTDSSYFQPLSHISLLIIQWVLFVQSIYLLQFPALIFSVEVFLSLERLQNYVICIWIVHLFSIMTVCLHSGCSMCVHLSLLVCLHCCLGTSCSCPIGHGRVRQGEF